MKEKEKPSTEQIVREIKRRTRRKLNSEEKIRVVLDGLRGEDSIAEICRREGINPNLFYRWSKSFMEAGKRRLNGDTLREASSDEGTQLRKENEELKKLLAEVFLENRLIKKT